MIQANELRIGNWVKVGETISTVCLIDHNKFIQLSGNAIVNRPEQIDPIALTPEILKGCGFVKVEESYGGVHYENKECWIYLFEKRGKFELELICSKEMFNLYRSYKSELHIFQNLYFSLTGTELNIKI